MGELANPNPQSEGMKLMSKLGVGMMTTEAFCDAARKLTEADVTNEYRIGINLPPKFHQDKYDWSIVSQDYLTAFLGNQERSRGNIHYQ